MHTELEYELKEIQMELALDRIKELEERLHYNGLTMDINERRIKELEGTVTILIESNSSWRMNLSDADEDIIDALINRGD